MINLIILFPIISGLLMFLFKRKSFDKLVLNLYSLIHIIITSFLCFVLDCEKYNNSFFAVDGLNKIFLLVLSFIFLMVCIYNNGYMKNFKEDNSRIRQYIFMVLIFVMSMTGTILSTDLSISWVFIEATTLSSAYLIYFNKTKNAIEAAWKYVFICSICIALAFVGIILLNIATESINSFNYQVLYDNAVNFNPLWLKLSFVFMLFGFGAKMGLAPVHFWLPDAHSEAPSPISALLSATLLNSAFLVIVRVFKIMEIDNLDEFARIILLLMGFLSLFITAVFVYNIKNYKRMLAYSSIENMGILVIGTALGGSAIYAVLLHLIGHSLAKASFFLTSGNILELFDSKRTKSTKGIVNVDRKTAWLWVFSFLAICAFPTSILFLSEFLIVKNMFLNNHYVLCILFLFLLTIILFGMGRVVLKMSFGQISDEKEKLVKVNQNKNKISIGMYIPQFILLTLVFTFGLYIPKVLNNLINIAVLGF